MHPFTVQTLRSRIGRVCISLSAATPVSMLDKARAALADSMFLEFRFDTLDDPNPAAFQPFLAEHPTLTAVATCRRSEYGGHFQGTLAEELAHLTTAAQSGFHILDLELESAEALQPAQLTRLRATAALLISHHNFTSTEDLEAIYIRIAAFIPDFFKIVSTATTLADNLTLRRLLERHGDEARVVAIAMNEPGIPSRILGPRWGAAFTFASASQGEETAPGQIDARTLRDLYRLDRIDPATKLYGVAGNPVRSSLSPLMLNTAFRHESINAIYLPLQTYTLPDLLHLAHELPLSGLSVTMPFKQQILPHLESLDPLAARIGACNTVVRSPDGKLHGFNTDVAGIVGPLEKRMPLSGTRVLVLGAGGAARAAVFGLSEKDAEVLILNRNPETAQQLAQQDGATVLHREAILETTVDIIVNATPVGMTGQITGSPLEAHELAALTPKLIFDLVYNPLETPLLRLASEQSIPTITGIEMFVHQGARQFELWTGKPAPEDEMLRVVLHALRQQIAGTGKPIRSPKLPAG